MEPLTPSDFKLHDLIARRWSPRAFASTAVSDEVLQTLLEAARWAPSCFNEQPWRFIIGQGQDSEIYRQIAACLVDANQAWACKAPVLMISVASMTFSHNGKPNRFAPHDVGLAMGNLALQATAMGLVIHQMGGFDVAAAKAAFAIPDEFQPQAAIALGYQGEVDDLPEAYRARETQPRTRKPIAAIGNGNWQAPW